jgi:sulfur-oxidizing protein SoxY
MTRGEDAWPTRRAALLNAAGAVALVGCGVAPRLAWAQAAAAAAMALTGGRTPHESDRIRLLMPRAFKNGDGVPVTVEVDSPMTAADYVKHVHLLADANPLPEIVSFHFGPRSGKARVVTRIRLAKSQSVLAVAEMADGSLLMTKAAIDIETDGCS